MTPAISAALRQRHITPHPPVGDARLSPEASPMTVCDAPTATTPCHTRRRTVTVAALTAGVCAVSALPLAHAVPNSAATPWVLTHTRTGDQVDLTEIVNNPAYENVDIDAVLGSIAAELRNANSAITLDQQTIAHTNTASTKGQAAVDAAASVIGTPYAWGGTTPQGFDCSGLVQWAHAKAGTQLPRTSGEMARTGTPVSREDMQPGDVIVYYDGASHVGLYAGDGMMIDSLGSGYTVDYRPVDYMPIHSIVRFA